MGAEESGLDHSFAPILLPSFPANTGLVTIPTMISLNFQPLS
jgi:hypothetical protein